MKRKAKCPLPAGVDELPKTAQRTGTAEPADYRLVPRLVSRIATEPLRRSPHPAHAVLLHAIIATTAAATNAVIAVIAAASGKSRIRPAPQHERATASFSLSNG